MRECLNYAVCVVERDSNARALQEAPQQYVTCSLNTAGQLYTADSIACCEGFG